MKVPLTSSFLHIASRDNVTQLDMANTTLMTFLQMTESLITVWLARVLLLPIKSVSFFYTHVLARRGRLYRSRLVPHLFYDERFCGFLSIVCYHIEPIFLVWWGRILLLYLVLSMGQCGILVNFWFLVLMLWYLDQWQYRCFGKFLAAVYCPGAQQFVDVLD